VRSSNQAGKKLREISINFNALPGNGGFTYKKLENLFWWDVFGCEIRKSK
jgi:hypothetical protein